MECVDNSHQDHLDGSFEDTGLLTIQQVVLRCRFYNWQASIIRMKPIPFLIFYMALRPVFYSMSIAVSRVSDLSILLIPILFRLKIPKSIFLLLWCQLAYLTIIFASLCSFIISNGNLLFLDLIEISRPFFWIIAIILGANLVQQMPMEAFFKIFVLLGMINSFFGLIMYFFPQYTYPIHYIFNVPSLFSHGRPGGFAYTHTEYVAINALALLSYLVLGKRNFVIIGILILSSLASMSKGGILFIVLFFCLFSVLYKRRILSLLILGILILTITALWSQIEFFLLENLPYLYFGFYQVMIVVTEGATTDGSVGPRYDDWIYALTYKINGLSYLIGNGPMRYLPDISYIESSVPNILFRFGVLGIIFFYSTYIFAVFKAPKMFRPHLAAFLIALFIVDMTANFSESIKFMCLLGVFLGGMIESKSGLVNSNR